MRLTIVLANLVMVHASVHVAFQLHLEPLDGTGNLGGDNNETVKLKTGHYYPESLVSTVGSMSLG